jgi:hypothetical protein
MADMSIKEIIRKYFADNPIPGVNSPEEFASHLNTLLQQEYKLIHSGSCLFVYKEVGKGVVAVDVLEGTDSEKDVLNNTFKAMLQLREEGYKEAEIEFNNKAAVKSFQNLPVLPVSVEQVDGGYVAKVRLA